MDPQAVKEFFDERSAGWDAGMIRNEEVIRDILDNAGIGPGMDILDVACGTGVLIPDYLSRGAASVTGIDLSSGMIGIASAKFADKNNVSFIVGDAVQHDYGRLFDAVMIYNALPHFPEPEALIARLSGCLKPGGTLTAAHGASREKIIARHEHASRISIELLPAEDLEQIFARYLNVRTVISDDRMYQVTGTR